MRTLECVLIALAAAFSGLAMLAGPASTEVDVVDAAGKPSAAATRDVSPTPRPASGDGMRSRTEAARARAQALLLFLAADRPPQVSDPAAALNRAREEHRPLFFWVGQDPDRDIEAEFDTAVHCWAPSNSGNPTPRLIVFPAGAEVGQPFARAAFGPATAAEIRKLTFTHPSGETMLFQRIANRIAALKSVQNLTPTQQSQLQAAAPTTPQSSAQLSQAASAVVTPPSSTPTAPTVPASTTSHPFLDLLQSFLTNPQEFQGAAQEIETIVSLFK